MDVHQDLDGRFAVTLDQVRYLQITHRRNLLHNYWPEFCVRLIEIRGGARLDYEPSIAEILDAVKQPGEWEEVVFTGPGEPTLRLYDCLEAARRIRERGGRVRLETDGLANLLYRRDITPDLEGSVDHLVVSLHTHDQSSYDRYFHSAISGTHRAVVEFARRARDFVPCLSLMAMDGADDVDLEACRRIAEDVGASFRPVAYVATAAH